MALFIATVTSPITPCILMKANRALYISTPGIMGMTLGMLRHWWGSVQATYHEAADDTNHCRPDKGAYDEAHIQSDVA